MPDPNQRGDDGGSRQPEAAASLDTILAQDLCPQCEGTGQHHGHTCHQCGGTGVHTGDLDGGEA